MRPRETARKERRAFGGKERSDRLVGVGTEEELEGGDGGLWRVGDGHGARGEGLVDAPDLPETGGQHPSATVHIVRPTCRACTKNINIIY